MQQRVQYGGSFGGASQRLAASYGLMTQAQSANDQNRSQHSQNEISLARELALTYSAQKSTGQLHEASTINEHHLYIDQQDGASPPRAASEQQNVKLPEPPGKTDNVQKSQEAYGLDAKSSQAMKDIKSNDHDLNRQFRTQHGASFRSRTNDNSFDDGKVAQKMVKGQDGMALSTTSSGLLPVGLTKSLQQLPREQLQNPSGALLAKSSSKLRQQPEPHWARARKNAAFAAAKGPDFSKVYGNSRYHRAPAAGLRKPSTLARDQGTGRS